MRWTTNIVDERRPANNNFPPTIQRLQALPQGKEMVYYRGKFTTDLGACAPRNHGDRGAPRCEALLRSVRNAAKALAAVGKVRLEQRRLTLTDCNGDFHVTEYVAIGI
ncbi:MAG: hypothetical protein Q7S95_01760 [bacterium]|nr:hypothetical protein [bacterium]